MRTNSLQEGGNDKGLSQDSIQEELEDEPLQFKGPDKDKEQEIERSKLFKAPDATSNMKFKEYEDHSLKHIWGIIFRKISLCF